MKLNKVRWQLTTTERNHAINTAQINANALGRPYAVFFDHRGELRVEPAWSSMSVPGECVIGIYVPEESTT